MRLARGASLVAALSELAARVQRGRTIDAVLEIAGRGMVQLGMRLAAYQLGSDELVLRFIATAPSRQEAIERSIGRPLCGLCAPLAAWAEVREVMENRRIVYQQDMNVFDRFMRNAIGFDPSTLDSTPETAGIANGVLAPLFVREQPWGLLVVTSRALTRDDADAVALFATQVGSALEVAETIAALERTNLELARAQAELVKQERLAALGELAAVVAHEVRNPLGVLFNSIGSLRRLLRSGSSEHSPAEAELLLRIAGEEAERLNRIVGDLLDFARPHEPRLQLGLLHEVVEQALEATAEPSRVRVVVAPNLPSIEMDVGLMRQAVLNLVLNGLQAMPKQGTLKVTTRAERRGAHDFVCVDVTDSGPGIPAELHRNIFEPFYTTKATGTGLGLAVVKRIVDAHRGEIAVASQQSGTTFTLRLPAPSAQPSVN